MTQAGSYRVLFGFVAWFASLGAVSAASGQHGEWNKVHSRVQLVAEQDALVPGETAMLGLQFEIERGWHIYQVSQNDTGLEPMVEWRSEADLGFGSIQWPAGHRFTQPGEILDHGYEGSVLLMVPVEVPASASAGEALTIAADVQWLACDAEQCVPGSAELSLTLPVRAVAEPSGDAEAFAEARAGMGAPVLGMPGEGISIAWDGTTMVVRAVNAASLSFVPGEGCSRVRGLFGSGASKTGELRLSFADDDGPVVGWVRVVTHDARVGASGVWLVRTRIGESP